MKRQYLGDSKDSFKWDYHDFLTRELNYPALVVALMLTPDDGSNHGQTDPASFTAREKVIAFCEELRNKRDLETIKLLPLKTGALYSVVLHKGDTLFNKDSRLTYFNNFDSINNQVVLLDPDNGFEPEKSCNHRHVRYSEISQILDQTPDESVVSVFQTARRVSFPDDFARITERIGLGFTTALYWHSLMFVAVSKSEETIQRVANINEVYASNRPLKVIPPLS